MSITTVGLDADDTLWHNETIFRLTQARFLDLLTDHDNDAIAARLAEVERRNLRLYGYGVKGFTLSMIETAMELCDGDPPPRASGWSGARRIRIHRRPSALWPLSERGFHTPRTPRGIFLNR